MFTFLLVLHALIAAALVAVILMQRSEGGGLGTGGGPAGLMTARGAADFLTRTTAVLAVMFVGMSVILAAVAGVSRAPDAIDTTFAREAKPMAPVTGGTPAGALPLPLGGLPGATGAPGVPAPGVPAPETTPSTLPSTDGAATRSDRNRKGDESSDSSTSSSSSSKRKRDASDGERNSRSSSSTSSPSSSVSTPIQLRETPKVGTLAPSQPTASSSSSSSTPTPAPTPKASSTPVATPTPPVTSGNGQ